VAELDIRKSSRWFEKRGITLTDPEQAIDEKVASTFIDFYNILTQAFEFAKTVHHKTGEWDPLLNHEVRQIESETHPIDCELFDIGTPKMTMEKSTVITPKTVRENIMRAPLLGIHPSRRCHLKWEEFLRRKRLRMQQLQALKNKSFEQAMELMKWQLPPLVYQNLEEDELLAAWLKKDKAAAMHFFENTYQDISSTYQVDWMELLEDATEMAGINQPDTIGHEHQIEPDEPER